MQNRTLKNLEYNKIISLLSSNCVTYIGKEIAEKLLPSNDIETVQMLQTETKEKNYDDYYIQMMVYI